MTSLRIVRSVCSAPVAPHSLFAFTATVHEAGFISQCQVGITKAAF